MTSLTTRQRDILKILLEANEPIGTKEIANSVQLSPRQVNYNMKGINHWLKSRDAQLESKPGVGVSIDCHPEEREKLAEELDTSPRLQLILTPDQRQQLICFYLLFETEPLILTQIAQLAKVSRTTVLTDLELIEEWLAQNDIRLERKQNYGIWVDCPEKIRQQAILKFIWGEMLFGPPLFHISFQNGLMFSLDEDAHFLPLVEKINHILNQIDMKKIFNKIVYVEDFLSGRFTDDAVLFLALVISILVIRAKAGQHIEPPIPESRLEKLQALAIWEAANKMVENLEMVTPSTLDINDMAYTAMYLMASPRVESWPSDSDQEILYRSLSKKLLKTVSKSYDLNALVKDPTLRDGLINHLIPVYNQQRFDLWFPRTQDGLPNKEKYAKEHTLAASLLEIIHKHTGYALPQEESNMIAALLRAAYIRLNPHHFHEVLVVCPSGMATAQLLTARLNIRFPRLGKLTVVSFRELSDERISQADMIITLMPLPKETTKDKPVIHVSPQLLPEDVEAITTFLA